MSELETLSAPVYTNIISHVDNTASQIVKEK